MELRSIEKSVLNEAFGLYFESLKKERDKLHKHILKGHKGGALSGYRDYKRELDINFNLNKIAIKLKNRIEGGID